MNFHWLRCRIKQKQFRADCAPVKEKFGDPPPTPHPSQENETNQFICRRQSPSTLKGCVEIMTQTPVTQTKRNMVMATAVLTGPTNHK